LVAPSFSPAAAGMSFAGTCEVRMQCAKCGYTHKRQPSKCIRCGTAFGSPVDSSKDPSSLSLAQQFKVAGQFAPQLSGVIAISILAMPAPAQGTPIPFWGRILVIVAMIGMGYLIRLLANKLGRE
jgi:hypothetical protein